jgi:hypothetical protein
MLVSRRPGRVTTLRPRRRCRFQLLKCLRLVQAKASRKPSREAIFFKQGKYSSAWGFETSSRDVPSYIAIGFYRSYLNKRGSKLYTARD